MIDADIIRLKNAVTERDHSWGSQNAPVTLVEYGNFECIDCKRAYPVIKKVQKLLGESLRFVFRHFPPQSHPHALRAAEAAEAAGAQGKFWEMHDQLFTHQKALEDPHLTQYAKRIGLDVERFARDMAENTFRKQIEADYQHSLFDEHITGTPTFYINASRYTGGTDVESLLVAIKEADTKEQIQMPKSRSGLKRLLGQIRRRTQ